MPELRYTRDNDGVFHHVPSGSYLGVGDTLTVDTDEAETLLNHGIATFEKVDSDGESEPDSESDESASAPSEATSEAPFDPRSFSVTELRDRLAEADLSSDDLDALEALENNRAHGPRSTALDAIEGA